LIFALYLYNNNIRRRIIDLLYFVNLIISYCIIQCYIKKLTNKIKRRFRLIKKLLITILIYNNFDYAKDKRDKKVNKIR